MSTSEQRVAVIGVGSPLMGDDGFGLRVLERLRERWSFEPGVELVDGGTWGMNLLPVIEEADAVILIDAIDVGWAPGTPVVLERESLPRFLGAKLSPHQIDLRDALALAEVRGRLPWRTVAIGAQPEVVALGTDLTPTLAGRVDLVAELVAARLCRWGSWCRRAEPAAACTN